jgi:uncharacterized membrane protein/predicted DsbA family dithiol-disulfide isomerase
MRCRVLPGIIWILALAGFINAAYLSVAHYRAHVDIGYASFCAVTKTINCDTVSQSPYSIFMGVPVPVWGVLGYLLFGLILALQRFSIRPASNSDQPFLPLLVTISFIFCIFSVLLGAIMATMISSYCILCTVSYAINFCLFYALWRMHRRIGKTDILNGLKNDWRHLIRHKFAAGIALCSFLLLTLSSVMAFPNYWDVTFAWDSVGVKNGITEEGFPWIGAEHPSLEIVEFTDYQCFQCKKMHIYLRRLVAQYPNRIRLLHRHYPMDHEFNYIVKDPLHIGSGKLALLAIHAEAHGKFWEMNDVLYRLAGSGREIDLRQLADETGLSLPGLMAALKHPGYHKRLEIDIRQGMKLRILGTPSYLINGQVHEGGIPAEILSAVMNR